MFVFLIIFKKLMTQMLARIAGLREREKYSKSIFETTSCENITDAMDKQDFDPLLSDPQEFEIYSEVVASCKFLKDRK